MERRKPGADQNSMGDVTLLSLFLEVRVQSIIDRELRRESILIRQTHCGKPLGDGTQPNALGGYVLLPLNVSSADDESQPRHCGIANFVVFDNCLEGASCTAMIEFYGINPWRVERNGVLLFRLLKQILFLDEQEFGLRIYESFYQPGAGNTIYFYVFACDPFHKHLTSDALWYRYAEGPV
jgi:hypothetical protein